MIKQYLKELLRKSLGNRFESLISRPHLALRVLLRRSGEQSREFMIRCRCVAVSLTRVSIERDFLKAALQRILGRYFESYISRPHIRLRIWQRSVQGIVKRFAGTLEQAGLTMACSSRVAGTWLTEAGRRIRRYPKQARLKAMTGTEAGINAALKPTAGVWKVSSASVDVINDVVPRLSAGARNIAGAAIGAMKQVVLGLAVDIGNIFRKAVRFALRYAVRYALKPLLWLQRRGLVLLQLVKQYLAKERRRVYLGVVIPTLKWLQVRHQAIGRTSRFNPLRLFCYPIELTVHWSEGRFRHSYAAFGEAVAAWRQRGSAGKGILLVSGTLGAGGAERQAVTTFMALAKRGLKPLNLGVVYLRNDYESFYLHKLEAAGLEPLQFNRDTARDEWKRLRDLLDPAKLLPPELYDINDYLRTFATLSPRPEAVHLWLDEVNVKGGLAAIATGARKVVLSVRNLPPFNFPLYHPWMREGYRWLVRQPGVSVVSNSAAGARAYEHWLGLPRGAIRVIHNGFAFDSNWLAECRRKRPEYRRRHGIPADALLVGGVFRLNMEKRPLLWAEIAARVARRIPAAHFLIIGDGPFRPKLEALARQQDLAGRLHIVGLETYVLQAIAAMDLLLLTSFAEGLPNVLIEAQALGVPVVTTPAGGAPETVVHGQTGRVLNNANPRAAAAVVARLLNDKDWLLNAGREGQAYVKNAFGVDRLLDETLEALDFDDYTRNYPLNDMSLSKGTASYD